MHFFSFPNGNGARSRFEICVIPLISSVFGIRDMAEILYIEQNLLILRITAQKSVKYQIPYYRTPPPLLTLAFLKQTLAWPHVGPAE